MMKIESVLQRQLAPIIERRELIHKRRRLTAVFLVVATLELMVIYQADVSALWILLPIAAGLVVNQIWKSVSRGEGSDLRAIARDIESENPELNALLLTAIEQDSEPGELGFLQERVVNEAAREAIAAQWGDTLEVGAQRGWRVAQGMATALMLAAGVWMFGSALKPHLPGASRGAGERAGGLLDAAGGGDWQIEVEPGDVEVERDSKLLVVARFAGKLPGSADLQLSSEIPAARSPCGRTSPTPSSPP